MENSNPTYFPKTFRIRNEIIELGPQDVKNLYNSKNLKELINKTFTDEYTQYIKDEQYFPGCSFRIYQKLYPSRLKEYLSIRPDADEFCFLEKEDAIISRILEMSEQEKGYYYSFYSGLYDEPHKENFKLSAEKTRNFIDSRIIDLGHSFYAPHFDDPFDIPVNLPRDYWRPARNPDIKQGAKDETRVITPLINLNSTEKKSSLSLKELFKDSSQFEKVVKNLIQDKILICDENLFRLNAAELEENKLSEIRAICALGYLLKTKHYLQPTTQDITIVNALSSFFNIPISKSAYNRAKEQCFNNGDHKAQDYFKLYYLI